MTGRFLITLTLILTAPGLVAEPGFLVAAPDRGFAGNEEIREAFAPFAEHHAAELVFVTDERGTPLFRAAARRLADRGHDPLVVLPLFLSMADARMAQLEDYMADVDRDLIKARPFGQRVHALAVLADRLAAVPDEAGKVMIAMDSGGESADKAALEADLNRLIFNLAPHWPDHKLQGLLIPPTRDAMGKAMTALEPGTHVVPFHLGRKLDAMMATTPRLRNLAPEGVTVHDGDVLPHEAVRQWLFAEAGRHLDGPVGVIVHAHGSDFHWNQTMREAASALEADFLVEYAFSMADPETIEAAVRRLESRGARQAVLIRVFGMASSFQHGLERLLGQDYERQWHQDGEHHHHHHHRHGNGPGNGPGHGPGHGHDMTGARRLSAHIPIVTVGGLENHPLFASALLDRARSLSVDPSNEVIVLVAHGTGSDERNRHWQEQLASLVDQMRTNGGRAFRAIEWATWREDWPDKREEGIERVRRIIRETEADNGRALLIPARTTGQGPARRFLPDETFELGEGFAPHPLFVEWLREQATTGMQQLRRDGAEVHGHHQETSRRTR